ncbi:hypothetical protein D3C85_1078760 [compost metagenome]
MAADAASFNTVMFSTSFGFTLSILPGTPSIITSGLLVPMVVIPLINMVELLPGAPLVLVADKPGTLPCKASDICRVCLPPTSLALILVIEPVKSFFFCVP